MIISTVVTSFGYGHGPAPKADVVLDVRETLRNPHHDPKMRELAGLHPRVHHHVMKTPGAQQLMEDTLLQVTLRLAVRRDPDRRVDIAVGCVGGRHRSVVLAEVLQTWLESVGVGAEAIHRDVDKPVLAAGH